MDGVLNKLFLDSRKQLHHQQQLGCGWEQQKCGRLHRPNGLRGCWGNIEWNICIMFAEPSFQSLDYVNNFAEATSQWEGFPITVGHLSFCLPSTVHDPGERTSHQHLGG